MKYIFLLTFGILLLSCNNRQTTVPISSSSTETTAIKIENKSSYKIVLVGTDKKATIQDIEAEDDSTAYEKFVLIGIASVGGNIEKGYLLNPKGDTVDVEKLAEKKFKQLFGISGK